MSSQKLSSDWDSVNDSALLASLNRVENHVVLSSEPNEVQTDADEGPLGDGMAEASKDFGSMNNSQFIKYVNEMSSFHQEYRSVTESQAGLYGTQGPNLSVYSNPDVISETDEMKAKEYAFTDHETYFSAKKDKQQLQDEEFLKVTDNTKTTIFSNCRIHVNGRTDPDIMTLRKLIVLNGGKFVHHLSSKGSATHIVAEHLPPRKRQEFANCKVVRVAWLMDSIKAGKMVNWAIYRLEGLNPFGQKQIVPIKDKIELRGEENADNTLSILELEPDTEILDEANIQGPVVDAKHPDFLSTFFAKSRLHYLSTWKADLRSSFLAKAISVLKERNIKQPPGRVILHVDFDCFFATVSGLKAGVDISKVPVCVTHGGGSADIASCNYAARKFGVSNGMWLSTARKLCPDLKCLSYEFDEYQLKSTMFYDYLLELEIDSILPVSIDEALIDISSLCEVESVERVIQRVKDGLDRITGCTVSCGAGRNVLLAKIALRKAKPNGVHYINDSKVLEEISDVAFDKLPGIGYKMNKKLSEHLKKENITLADIRPLSREELSTVFGIKTAEMIVNYAIGEDSTSIDIVSNPEEYARKSVGIDINWGIRFDTDLQVEGFLNRLAVELTKRLMNVGMKGSNMTLKFATRHPDAPVVPSKYLGMGRCNFASKSSKFGVPTRETSVLASEMRYVWRYMNIEPAELRGVSVHMSPLVSDDIVAQETANQMKLNFKKVDLRPKEEEQVSRLQPRKIEYSPIKKSREGSPATLEQEIDWEVFGYLPKDIQQEIRGELRRRALRTSPKKRKVFNNDRDIAHLVSPKKRQPNPPVVNEYRIPERKVSVLFQGTRIEDMQAIKAKISHWLDLTVRDGSVNPEDMLMFNSFMGELLMSRLYAEFWDLTAWLRVMVDNRAWAGGVSKWEAIVDTLVEMFNDQSYTEMEYTF